MRPDPVQRLVRSSLVLACALPLTACSIPLQAQPVPLQVAAEATEAPPVARGPAPVTIYLLREGRLRKVVRGAPETSAEAALEQLLAGPSGTEVASGLTTALVPQRVSPFADPADEPGTMVLDGTSNLTSVSGEAQLLAVAQMVWTVTALSEADRVRFTVDGLPVEVPTDGGLRAGAVTRGDYTSVAPQAPAGGDELATDG